MEAIQYRLKQLDLHRNNAAAAKRLSNTEVYDALRSAAEINNQAVTHVKNTLKLFEELKIEYSPLKYKALYNEFDLLKLRLTEYRDAIWDITKSLMEYAFLAQATSLEYGKLQWGYLYYYADKYPKAQDEFRKLERM